MRTRSSTFESCCTFVFHNGLTHLMGIIFKFKNKNICCRLCLKVCSATTVLVYDSLVHSNDTYKLMLNQFNIKKVCLEEA